MLRTGFLSLILFVSLSSTSLLRKSISRRQSEPETCYAIEGFDCRCTSYRVTCTSERDIPQAINVLPNEQQKYQSVELVLNGEREQNVYDYTFEPVKKLFKPDADHVEFRIKFEKFTALGLLSPGIFNKVFPDNLPSNARKVMALEIYNLLVQPNDNVNLFSNLNVDSLEIYVFYPLRGTFQQLFSGANIKYMRLSGAEMRSDLSQPFNGNVGRLELVKQASQLSVQNFPAYPAHEMIIHAFYVSDFTSENPPNYSNLAELHVHSLERIPANAFQQYPNLNILSVSTEKDIDPHAFGGLNNLEKLIIKDTQAPLDLLNSVPTIKEFETNIDKYGDREQCDLIEKLANGQLAVQAIPNGYQCTCVSAYLDFASGRYPCDAQNCEQSACPAIRDNYDTATRTFKELPPIKRADGTNALRQREQKVYTTSYRVPQGDKDKVQKTLKQQDQSANGQDGSNEQQPAGGEKPAGQWEDGGETATDSGTSGHGAGHHEHGDEHGQWQPDAKDEQSDRPDSSDSHGSKDSMAGDAGENAQDGGDQGKSQDGESTKVPGEGEAGQEHSGHGDGSMIDEGSNSTDISAPSKKKFNWLPILIIVGIIVLILLVVLIAWFVLKKKPSGGYNKAATSDQGTASGSKA